MKNGKLLQCVAACAGLLLAAIASQAQLTLTGQVRTRTEYRDGLGTLRPQANKPAFFTSQRSRLTLNYKSNRITLQTSLQDVRLWGQDASTISNADGNKLALHEAWADIILSNKKDSSFTVSPVEYFSVKIGRQELLYDDSRLLGNLDWLQQARRHDAVVFKLLQSGWQLDLGAAFNQNTDAFNYNGTYYTPANVAPYARDTKGNIAATPMGLIPIVNGSGISTKSGSLSLMNPPSTNGLNQHYKAMQFAWAAKSFGSARVSFLFLSDQFSKYVLDSVRSIAGTDTGYVYGRRYNQPGVNTRFTTGLLSSIPLNKNKSFALTAGAWYQGGKDKEGISLAAFMSTLALTHTKNKWSFTAGWDYVSGNDAFSGSATNHRFDPLYGTPHKFWGYMDYFYVGTGAPAGGLSNPFFKIKYSSSNKRFTTGIDYHYFMLAADQKNESGAAIDKYLGSEIDWISSYSLNKVTNLELGLAFLAASNSMAYAKNIAPGTARQNAQWAYLQINIRPEFLIK
jgi:hypothetical protein